MAISQFRLDQIEKSYFDQGLDKAAVAKRMDSLKARYGIKVAIKKSTRTDTAKFTKKTAKKVSKGTGIIEDLKAVGKKTVEKTQEQLGKLKDSSAGSKVTGWLEKFGNVIKKHPVAAVAVTALAAIIGTKIFSGSSETPNNSRIA